MVLEDLVGHISMNGVRKSIKPVFALPFVSYSTPNLMISPFLEWRRGLKARPVVVQNYRNTCFFFMHYKITLITLINLMGKVRLLVLDLLER